LSYEIFQAVQSKDFDRVFQSFREQAPLWQFASQIEKKRQSLSVIPGGLRGAYSYMSVGKAAMDLAGLSGGHLRLPTENFTTSEKKELRTVLKEIGAIP
jgi:dihydrodipicolinate synthase/N-acetylneuraminate lyase